MDRRRLGRTDLMVPSICLGTMTWGQQNTEAEAFAQMDYAFENGIDFFDTAEIYAVPPKPETQGKTEAYIGAWLKERKTRDRVIIASKVAGRSDMTWLRAGGAPTSLTKQQINEAIDASLKRLNTDYIDLYQVHFPDRPTPLFGRNGTVYIHQDGEAVSIEETLDALAELVRAGKVRHLGISNESPWGTMRYLGHAERTGAPRIQSIQNAYNLVNRTFEVGLAEIAHREHVGLLAYSPLAQGYLTGKYQDGVVPEGSRKKLFERMARYEKPGADTAHKAYFALARDYGLTPVQLALRFVETRPFVTSSIIGATTMAQLRENIATTDVPWTDELEDAVNAIHQVHQNPSP